MQCVCVCLYISLYSTIFHSLCVQQRSNKNEAGNGNRSNSNIDIAFAC